MPRMKWTNDRHNLFVQAVEYLGGERRATPKNILKYMDERDLTFSHVKSHLQLYRNMKKEESLTAESSMRQSQQYLQVYERARDATQFIQNQQRLQLDITEKVNPNLESSSRPMEVSCNSLYQSSRVGQNENTENESRDNVVVGDGTNGEEEFSVELTLGLKY